MPIRTRRTPQTLCMLALMISGLPSTYADESSPSLYERRLGILKGTSKGVVLYELDKAEPTAAPVPTSAKAETYVTPSDTALPQAPVKSGFLSKLPPPSGRSLDAARRMGALDGGIAVSTARAASQPQAEPVAKP